MHQYNQGEKGANVGFARVEARNGEYIITISLQPVSKTKEEYRIYLIKRKSQGIELIYLGNGNPENHALNARIMVKEEKLNSMGYDLDDFKGIVIFVNDNYYYGTQWDSIPIVRAEVLDAKNYLENKDVIEEDDTSETVEVVEELEVTSETEETIEILKAEDFESVEVTETIEDVEVSETQSEFEEVVVEVISESQDESVENLEVVEVIETTEEVREEAPIEVAQMEGQGSVWHSMAKGRPQVKPFEDPEVTECIQLTPDDINSLPKELWGLGNNSFILHGYHGYNHLILCKVKNRDTHQYILGVPGIFCSRERFMARMFGFEKFKPARRREIRQGEFGYWYIFLDLNKY